MRLLLDTNAIIWWDSKSSKLSKKVQAALRDTSNEVFISVVSAWEMQIKAQIGANSRAAWQDPPPKADTFKRKAPHHELIGGLLDSVQRIYA